MRMDESPVSVDTPTVTPEATPGTSATVASAAGFPKTAADSEAAGDASSVAEVTPPPSEVKLNGKDLLEALKNQVGGWIYAGRSLEEDEQ